MLSGKTFGFTLVEMAIVMLIISLMMGAGMMAFSKQSEIQKMKDTEKILEEVREALIGFAASKDKPHLPCPDTDSNGQQGARRLTDNIPLWRNGDCIQPEGRLPWVTLGLGASDAWGNRFRYRVLPSFSNNTTGFGLSATANLEVYRAAGGARTLLANELPAVILSHGHNRLGAWNEAGVQNQMPSNPDELENTDTNDDFVAQSDHDAFDDIVIWISPNILKSRMIQAGRLP